MIQVFESLKNNDQINKVANRVFPIVHNILYLFMNIINIITTMGKIIVQITVQ